MVKLEIEDLKMLREALCVAQSAIGQAYSMNQQKPYVTNKIDAIQKVIDEIDILRPLGPDGKHGNLHTEFCGCEYNPYLDLLNEWRVIPAFPFYELSGRGDVRVSENVGQDISRVFSNNEVEYELWAQEAGGYCDLYSVSATELHKHTFPELRKD